MCKYKIISFIIDFIIYFLYYKILKSIMVLWNTDKRKCVSHNIFHDNKLFINIDLMIMTIPIHYQ